VSLIGCAIAVISLHQHFRIQREGLETSSFCAISEKVNCDVVNASSYSTFLEIPVAGWAIAFYTATLLFSLLALLIREGRGIACFAWVFSLPTLLASIYLAYVSMVILGVICLECVSLYAVNIFLVVFFFVGAGIPFGGMMTFLVQYGSAVSGKKGATNFPHRFFLCSVLVLAVLFIGWAGVSRAQEKWGGKGDNISVDEKVKAFYLQSLYSLEIDPMWPMWGNPEAKVTIIEFSDFQCPFCKVAAFNVKPRLAEFRDDVRLFFVNFPLDQSCNKEMQHPMHPFACLAARAALCEGKRGDFWGFHDDLFREQKGLNEEKIFSVAEKRGWTQDTLTACMNSPVTRTELLAF